LKSNFDVEQSIGFFKATSIKVCMKYINFEVHEGNDDIRKFSEACLQYRCTVRMYVCVSHFNQVYEGNGDIREILLGMYTVQQLYGTVYSVLYI